MKRMIAILALICCLCSFCCTALAVPEEGLQDEALTEETTLQDTEEPTEGPVEEPTEEPAEETVQEPVKIDTNELASIEAETAIRTMEVTAAVDEAGRAGVSISVEMNIVGTVKELRFSFPEGAKRPRILGYSARSEKEHGVEYLIIRDRNGFAGNTRLEMSYTISGIVSEGEDSQIMTLPLLSLQDYRTGMYTFGVAMPSEVTTTPRFSSGYYNDLVQDIMTVRTEDVWIVGAMNEIIRDNDTLTMTLVVPQGYFVGRHGESGMPKVLTTMTLILLAVVLIYWVRTLRNPPLKVRARSLPPDGINPGDLPMLLAGDDANFHLLVSHWAALGYVSVYVSKKGHVLFYRQMDMGNERRKLEQKLFHMLFGENDVCDGSSVRYKRASEKAVQVIRRYWNKRLYEKYSGAPMVAAAICALAGALASVVAVDALAPAAGHGFFLFLALVAGAAMSVMIYKAPGAYYMNNWVQVGIGIGCGLLLLIIGGVGETALAMVPAVGVTLFMGWQTSHGGKRSPYGDEVLGQTLGFRRFMLHTSEHYAMQALVRDSQYFYKMLPYAEAMGQGRRFVSLFQNCKLEPCQWYEDAHGFPNTSGSFYDHYKDTLDILNMAVNYGK